MFDDDVIYPISGTMILIVVGSVIAVTLGALEGLIEIISTFLFQIEVAFIVISTILAIINIIRTAIEYKKVTWVSMLAVLAYAIGCSQLVFFFHNSFLDICDMSDGVARLIKLVLWLIVVLANAAITFFAQGFCIVDVEDDDPFYVLLCGGVGIIGWIVNIVIYVV